MKSSSNKYTRLFTNTALFAISTFSSKVLSFALTRLYTSVLTEASFGVVDLITASANLLIPLVSLGISNAVIRFGLEKDVSKSGVFMSGLASIASGFAILLMFLPIISNIPVVSGQVILLYIYVLVSCLRTLCCQFIRARLYIRLYAIDGILSTAYTIGFNVLFLVVLDMGSTGYLLSIILADLLSTIGLFFVARLWQYIKIKKFDWTLHKSMLRYSLPLVPALMFWWVTTASDRFFITFMCGPAENGLYAVANKVPSIVAILSTIFTEAWQLSAVTDGQDTGRNDFFSNVFQALASVTFIVGGVLIYSSQWIMRILVAPDFFIAWRYVPFLVMSTVFSSLVAFLNSVYMVEKKSSLSLVTMMLGAVVNLILNYLFIPLFGPNGAAFATFISYLIVFIVRAINTQRFIRIDFKPLRQAANTLLLGTAAFLMIGNPTLWQLWCALPVGLLIALNATGLYKGLMQVIKKRRAAKALNKS